MNLLLGREQDDNHSSTSAYFNQNMILSVTIDLNIFLDGYNAISFAYIIL